MLIVRSNLGIFISPAKEMDEYLTSCTFSATNVTVLSDQNLARDAFLSPEKGPVTADYISASPVYAVLALPARQ